MFLYATDNTIEDAAAAVAASRILPTLLPAVLRMYAGRNGGFLLKPPSLSEEQQQIYLALQDAVGSGITLQYPRAGANLSAFTVVDLDGDGEDEALVFYKRRTLPPWKTDCGSASWTR